ncbi:hypothetical protein M758_5G186800 [Ceratodon purpureus]|nr:hypothetical protein M758_5G186800 [Ceratodon purpureus]
MASSDGSPVADPTEDNSSFGERLLERMEGLLRRGVASELSASEVASQVLGVIQEWVAFKAQNPDEFGPQFVKDTPGVESMGWELWDAVDRLAREDERHHDALISFINAFLPLLRMQPWQIWGEGVQNSSFLLGPAFRESLNQFEKMCPGENEINENQMISRWVNYCRFVARMTRDTENDFSLFLLWFAREALEDCSWCSISNLDASILALEGVIDVCGVQMIRSDEDYGTSGAGGDGVRKWDGKSGFCKERWLFWEAGLLDIARDEARPVDVRDSAQRTATKMKSIRDGLLDVENSGLPSRTGRPSRVQGSDYVQLIPHT